MTTFNGVDILSGLRAGAHDPRHWSNKHRLSSNLYMTKSLNTIQSACLLVTALALTACGNLNRDSYSSIEPGAGGYGSNLALPPDLVDTSNETLASRAAEEETEEVLPEPEELDIERNNEEGWLQVEAPAGKVWNRLAGYWGSLGIDLVVSDPQAGLMETEWVKPAKSKYEQAGVADDLLDQFIGRLIDAPTSLDRYAMRLEKIDDETTRVHVSHTGLKKIQTSEAGVARNAAWEWVETEEDPEKVRRALSSLAYGLQSDAS